MFDRRLLEHFDWGLLLLILAVSACGLTVLYSAVTAGWEGTGFHPLFERQLVWMGAGAGIMTAVLFFDFRKLNKLNIFIYAGCVILLLGVFFWPIGRWIPTVAVSGRSQHPAVRTDENCIDYQSGIGLFKHGVFGGA